MTGKGTQTAFIGGTSGAYNAKNVTTWETVSDMGVKRNIVDSVKGLAEIMQLRVRTFNYKAAADMPVNSEGEPLITGLDSEKLITGVVAQELQRVFPEAVTENSTGLLSINADSVLWALVRAVQELNAKVDALATLRV